MLDLNALEAEGKLVPWRTRAKSATGNKFLYAGRGSMGDHMFVSMQRDATERAAIRASTSRKASTSATRENTSTATRFRTLT